MEKVPFTVKEVTLHRALLNRLGSLSSSGANFYLAERYTAESTPIQGELMG